MNDRSLVFLTGRFTYAMLIASGVASAVGIASVVGVELSPHWTGWRDAIITALFLLIGLGFTTTALMLYTHYDKSKRFSALFCAMMLSFTNVLGFITVATAKVDQSFQATRAITQAEDHYYLLYDEYQQLIDNKKLAERRKKGPALQLAKDKLDDLRGSGTTQASALAIYVRIADLFGINTFIISLILLTLMAITLESGLAYGHIATRRAVAELAKQEPKQKAKRSAKQKPKQNSKNLTTVPSDLPFMTSERRNKIIEAVLEEARNDNPNPFATVQKMFPDITRQGVRSIYQAEMKRRREAANA